MSRLLLTSLSLFICLSSIISMADNGVERIFPDVGQSGYLVIHYDDGIDMNTLPGDDTQKYARCVVKESSVDYSRILKTVIFNCRGVTVIRYSSFPTRSASDLFVNLKERAREEKQRADGVAKANAEDYAIGVAAGQRRAREIAQGQYA